MGTIVQCVDLHGIHLISVWPSTLDCVWCLWVPGLSREWTSIFCWMLGADNFRIWLILFWTLRDCKGLNSSFGEFQTVSTLSAYSTPQPSEDLDASNSWVFLRFQSLNSLVSSLPILAPCRHYLLPLIFIFCFMSSRFFLCISILSPFFFVILCIFKIPALILFGIIRNES